MPVQLRLTETLTTHQVARWRAQSRDYHNHGVIRTSTRQERSNAVTLRCSINDADGEFAEEKNGQQRTAARGHQRPISCRWSTATLLFKFTTFGVTEHATEIRRS